MVDVGAVKGARHFQAIFVLVVPELGKTCMVSSDASYDACSPLLQSFAYYIVYLASACLPLVSSDCGLYEECPVAASHNAVGE